jgi:hypothetical protein
VPLGRRVIPFGLRVLNRIHLLAVRHFSSRLHKTRRVLRLDVKPCVPIPAVARPRPVVYHNNYISMNFIARHALVDIDIIVKFVRRTVTYSVL